MGLRHRTGAVRIRPAVHGEAEVFPSARKSRRGGYTLRAALIAVLLSAPGTQGPGRPALRGAPSILHLLRIPEYSSYRPLHGGSGVILRNGIVLWRSFPARPRTAQGVTAHGAAASRASAADEIRGTAQIQNKKRNQESADRPPGMRSCQAALHGLSGKTDTSPAKSHQNQLLP